MEELSPLEAAAAQPDLQGSVGLPAAVGEEPTLEKEEKVREGGEEGEMVNIDSPPLIWFCSKQNYINGPFMEVKLVASPTVEVD